MQVDEQERNLLSKEELENKIATFTQADVWQRILIFDSITTGASNDIEQATKLARGMITRYGMSDEVRHDGAGNGERTSTWAVTLLWHVRAETAADIDEMVVELV